jgi:uncharacterized Tic20 family protein
MNGPPSIVIPPEQRGLAVIAHLSGLAGYIIPLGGVIAPIVIWAMKREDRIIASIAQQALLLNVIVFVLAGAFFLLFLTILLIPVAILGWIGLLVAAVALPIVGAMKASGGEYYRYPVVGIAP